MDLLGSNISVEKSFLDFASEGDKRGALVFLRGLTQKNFEHEVLIAGYSMIGFHHGKAKVMEHVLSQFKHTSSDPS